MYKEVLCYGYIPMLKFLNRDRKTGPFLHVHEHVQTGLNQALRLIKIISISLEEKLSFKI